MSGPGYGCAADNCTQPVNWLLTHMRPAGTLSVCDDHAPVFIIGMLAEVLGVEVGPLYDVIRKHIDRQAAKAAKAAADAYDTAQAAEAEQAAADDRPPDNSLIDAVRAEYTIPPAQVPAGGDDE